LSTSRSNITPLLRSRATFVPTQPVLCLIDKPSGTKSLGSSSFRYSKRRASNPGEVVQWLQGYSTICATGTGVQRLAKASDAPTVSSNAPASRNLPRGRDGADKRYALVGGVQGLRSPSKAACRVLVRHVPCAGPAMAFNEFFQWAQRNAFAHPLGVPSWSSPDDASATGGPGRAFPYASTSKAACRVLSAQRFAGTARPMRRARNGRAESARVTHYTLGTCRALAECCSMKQPAPTHKHHCHQTGVDAALRKPPYTAVHRLPLASSLVGPRRVRFRCECVCSLQDVD
jgi:hypothetical protein